MPLITWTHPAVLSDEAAGDYDDDDEYSSQKEMPFESADNEQEQEEAYLPEVECEADAIAVTINTKHNFNGFVYVEMDNVSCTIRKNITGCF